MNINSDYKGLVTFNFFDKDGNIKSTIQKHNRGTPYLFSILTNILKYGVSTLNDTRPGKIALTKAGYITIDNISEDKTITINDSSTSSSDPLNNELRMLIPKISILNNSVDTILDNAGNQISKYTPCIRYEFNISSYDFKNITNNDNLIDYRFWLLSSSESEFHINTIPLTVDPSTQSDDSDDLKIKALIDNISYDIVKDNITSQICAQVQLKSPDDDADYTLNEGEYVSVLWDMFFDNNDSSN